MSEAPRHVDFPAFLQIKGEVSVFHLELVSIQSGGS